MRRVDFRLLSRFPACSCGRRDCRFAVKPHSFLRAKPSQFCRGALASSVGLGCSRFAVIWRATALNRRLWVTGKLWGCALMQGRKGRKNGNITGTVSCVLYGTSVTFFGKRRVPCLDIPLSVAPSAGKKDIVFFQCVPPFVHHLFTNAFWQNKKDLQHKRKIVLSIYTLIKYRF